MTAAVHHRVGGAHVDHGGAEHLVLESERDSALSTLHHGIGYGHGYRDGYEAGYATCDEQWQKIMGVYREAVARPLSGAAFASSVAPCPARCRECSRCTRYVAAYRNRQAYGSADFPGGAVQW